MNQDVKIVFKLLVTVITLIGALVFLNTVVPSYLKRRWVSLATLLDYLIIAGALLIPILIITGIWIA